MADGIRQCVFVYLSCDGEVHSFWELHFCPLAPCGGCRRCAACLHDTTAHRRRSRPLRYRRCCRHKILQVYFDLYVVKAGTVAGGAGAATSRGMWARVKAALRGRKGGPDTIAVKDVTDADLWWAAERTEGFSGRGAGQQADRGCVGSSVGGASVEWKRRCWVLDKRGWCRGKAFAACEACFAVCGKLALCTLPGCCCSTSTAISS